MIVPRRDVRAAELVELMAGSGLAGMVIMKKPKKAAPADPISKPEKAPPTEDQASETSCPEEAAVVPGGARGAVVGGLLGGAGGAVIGGAFGLIGGALEDDEKKSKW
ncbi:Hypothetical protein A7982_11077 [Minicystis rosea]|nr:Hypothetical protein A7982_11077 [Minicystis rosea]